MSDEIIFLDVRYNVRYNKEKQKGCDKRQAQVLKNENNIHKIRTIDDS